MYEARVWAAPNKQKETSDCGRKSLFTEVSIHFLCLLRSLLSKSFYEITIFHACIIRSSEV